MSKTKNAKRFTAKQLKEFQESLLAQKHSMSQQIRSLGESALVSARSAGEESADIGTDNFTRETEISLMSQDNKQLALINMALSSLESDTYGVCVDCGEEIPAGRLKAKPYARLCIKCKEAREANGGLPPEGMDFEDGEELELTE